MATKTLTVSWSKEGRRSIGRLPEFDQKRAQRTIRQLEAGERVRMSRIGQVEDKETFAARFSKDGRIILHKEPGGWEVLRVTYRDDKDFYRTFS